MTSRASRRYWGLRGLVHHVLWRTGRDGRAPAAGIAYTPTGKAWGRCTWCGLPTKSKGRKWHHSCVEYYRLAAGQHSNVQKLYQERPERCRCGAGRPTEIDHILAIGVAQRLGRRAYVRAFLPENLHWICRDCHAV